MAVKNNDAIVEEPPTPQPDPGAAESLAVPSGEPVPPKPAPVPAPDPFSREALRNPGSAQPTAGGTPELFEIEVRKPKPFEWVRTWADTDSFSELLDPFVGLSGTSYILAPGLVREIPSLVSIVWLHPTITRQGLVYLWKILERDRQGRQSSSAASQQEAALRARTEWIQIAWPASGAKAYQIIPSPIPLSEPEWPVKQSSYMDYVRLGYRGRLITSLDDPAIRSLINKLMGLE
jgi:hypothetical protein